MEQQAGNCGPPVEKVWNVLAARTRLVREESAFPDFFSKLFSRAVGGIHHAGL